ncbi:MAG: hypothetical protein Q7U76_12705 [Nitrospirota bacterium]|nr:hypothetical protein [Nitrospirota bacterium]
MSFVDDVKRKIEIILYVQFVLKFIAIVLASYWMANLDWSHGLHGVLLYLWEGKL